MHCPRCGSDALTRQPFCRSCGFNLEKVSELLAEQPVTVANTNFTRLHERQLKLERWAGRAGLGTFGIILLMLQYMVISQMILKAGMVVPGILLIVLSIGVALMAMLQVHAKSLKRELSRKQLSLSAAPGREIDIHEPLSITENTTELLHALSHADTKEV